ncbi:MAG: alanine--tRNA ligase-related protein [Halobacteriales archaeon]
MTEALYLDDPTRRTFDATVERTVDGRVVLDRTGFYPTGGGQPHDTGTLSDGERTWTVEAVEKRDTIYHTVDGDPPAAGTTVTGELDWDRRYAHMRYHTAQHLVSAVLLEAFDAETTGNQLYADRARLDCAYDRFTTEALGDLEARVNDLIDEDLPVEWYELDRSVAEAELDPERTRLDLLPDSIRTVRLVEIGDVDRTACAGTHVASTGELGEVTVTGRETKGAGEERVEFTLSGT